MAFALSLPVAVLLILGVLLIVLDGCLVILAVLWTRPQVLPAWLRYNALVHRLQSSLQSNQPSSFGNSPGLIAGHSNYTPPNKPNRDAGAIKTALLNNVNHEIRTPLAGIMATAQILHDEVGPHHQELTEMLVESSKRMDNALRNVIELVALKENKYQLDKVPVQVHDEIDSMVSLHQKQAESKGITLHAGPINKDLTLKTDPQLLRKVLNHLINNAIKFTDEGYVQLSVRQDNKWLHVEIKDSGIGINKAFLPKIYQPFLQESDGLSRTHNGQGLGLALTKHMIDLAGGKIDIDSNTGKGSTFTVSYPSAC